MKEYIRSEQINHQHLRIDTQPQQQENNYDYESPLKTEKSDHQGIQRKEVYTQDEMKKFRKQGIISLIGGILLHIQLGTFYVWGSINPYVAAWMRLKDKSVSLNLISLIFPISLMITMSVVSFGIKIAEKIGFKITIGCGSFTIALTYLLISFIQDIGGFIVIYCIMVGISTGLLYMLPIISGLRYFPNKRGMVSGFILIGFGLGYFVFNFICRTIANPNNLSTSIEVIEEGKIVKYFDNQVGEKVPLLFQVLAISNLGFGIIGTLMIKFPKDIDPDKMLATIKFLELNNIKESEDPLPIQFLPVYQECKSIIQGLKSKQFFLLLIIALMSSTFGMLILNCYKLYGLELGIDDELLTTAGSLAAIMNCASTFFWSHLIDKTSYKFTFTIISILNLMASSILPYNTNGIGYLLIIGVVYFAQGGLLATYPMICVKIYGKKICGLIQGFMFFMVGVSNIIGYILYAFVRNIIGWSGVFWICFSINIVGIIIAYILKEVGNDWRDPQIIVKEKSEFEMQNKINSASLQ